MTWNATLLPLVQGANSRLCTLVEVALTVPSALTIQVSEGLYQNTLDLWPPFIHSTQPITEAGEYLDGGGGVASTAFAIPTRAQLPWFAAGTSLIDALQQYEWMNAKVTMWVNDATLVLSNRQQTFVGYINRIDVRDDITTFYCLGDRNWNVMVPPTDVNSTSYPNSPEGSKGVPKPILIGDVLALNMRDPWTNPTADLLTQWKSGAGRAGVKCVIVDPGLGAGKAKFLVAGHRTKIAKSDYTVGAFIGFELQPGLLSLLEDASTAGAGITEFQAADESGFTVDDEKLIAYTAVLPVDVRVTGTNPTNATNPRGALGALNEVDAAHFDVAGGKNQLTLVLPSLSSLGTILEVRAFVGYNGLAGAAGNMRVNPLDPASGAKGTIINMGAATGGAPQVVTGIWDATWWTQQWDFGGNGAHAAIDLSLDMTGGGAGGKVDVYWACLVVKHRIALSMVTPPVAGYSFFTRGTPAKPAPRDSGRPPVRRVFIPGLPGVFQLDAVAFGCFRGLTDTGGGAYSGSASTTLTKVPDVIMGLLCEMAGLSTSDFETGAGVFGSFTDMRDRGRWFQPEAQTCGFQIVDRSTMSDLLQSLCQQFGLSVYLDPEDGKWRIFAWRDGDALDYATALLPQYMNSLEQERTSDIELVTGARVQWLPDVMRGKQLMECHVGSAGSGRGYNSPELRDEQSVVDGTNNKFDYVENALAKTVTLTSGTRKPIDIAIEIMQAVFLAAAGGHNFYMGHGFTTKAGLDYIQWQVGGTPYAFHIGFKEWVSPHVLAEYVQAQLNAANSGRTFTVTYSDATNRFSVSATGGTWDLLTLGNQDSGWPVLGICSDQMAIASGTPATTQRPCYARRYWWMTNAWNLTPQFGTGLNAAVTAGPLLGWQAKDRTAANTDFSIWPVGDLEQTCAARETAIRKRRVISVDGWAIRGELMAVEARRRETQQRSRSRLLVTFTTTQCPDMKKGMVFKFHADVANLQAPALQGVTSWDDLRFRVIERSRSASGHHEVTFRAIEC